MNASKPILLSLGLIFLIAVNVCAQENPPAPAADFVPQSWKEFVANDGTFKVLMPGVPREVSQPVEGKAVSGTTTLYSLATRAAEYAVGVTTFSQNIETLQPSKLTLDGIRDRTLAKESGKLLGEQDIIAESHPGRALTIEVADGIFRDRYFLVGNRLYTVPVFIPRTVAASESDTRGIRKSQEDVAKRFLDSFKLILR